MASEASYREGSSQTPALKAFEKSHGKSGIPIFFRAADLIDALRAATADAPSPRLKPLPAKESPPLSHGKAGNVSPIRLEQTVISALRAPFGWMKTIAPRKITIVQPTKLTVILILLFLAFYLFIHYGRF
jgi:hypothetical protein